MCYSGMVKQDLKSLQRQHGARVDYACFEQLFRERLANDRIKVPLALEASFRDAASPAEERIWGLIAEYRARRAKELEAELFRQRKRLADAERSLRTKTTKAALESRRIAESKVAWHLEKLADLSRIEPKPDDSRIFPFHFAPVLVVEAGERVIKPMRYHCRPAGKPEFYDRKFDGLYNARRDNLEGFWKGQFGHTHAVVVMTDFFENVARHDFEHRPLAPGEKAQNMVLQFNPQPPIEMRVACLWSRWRRPGEPDLLSFAAITDEPPPEVAATGHNRCVIPLKERNVETWLAPAGREKGALYALLDDRERPYYEHRLAA